MFKFACVSRAERCANFKQPTRPRARFDPYAVAGVAGNPGFMLRTKGHSRAPPPPGWHVVGCKQVEVSTIEYLEIQDDDSNPGLYLRVTSQSGRGRRRLQSFP